MLSLAPTDLVTHFASRPDSAARVWLDHSHLPSRPPVAEPGGVLMVAEGVAVADRLPATDLTVCSGEVVAVTGPPGSGKSTLLACLAGLLEPSAGTVRVSSEPGGRARVDPWRWASAEIAGTFGVVFQNPEHQFVTGRVNRRGAPRAGGRRRRGARGDAAGDSDARSPAPVPPGGRRPVHALGRRAATAQRGHGARPGPGDPPARRADVRPGPGHVGRARRHHRRPSRRRRHGRDGHPRPRPGHCPVGPRGPPRGAPAPRRIVRVVDPLRSSTCTASPTRAGRRMGGRCGAGRGGGGPGGGGRVGARRRPVHRPPTGRGCGGSTRWRYWARRCC